ncbi:MAG: LysM peptidoglycan-binding domain-containing protein, partial [Saprospiraceae bacterium]|nr:LysM peptidoglycan-binding domain-containing protein [Saprospiraceae bacterium]
PGRVQKAMRYAGSKDYWTIREYLPVETQGYVPAFIAATYFANFYADHGLTPRISVNLPETVETVLVNQPLSFSKIAYASGVDMAQLVKLNPGYVKRALPGGDKAYYLMLPSEAVPAVKKLIRESGRKELEAPPGTFRTTYLVRSGMSIESLAELVNCSVKDIMNWNDLPAPEVMVGQQLVLFLSKEYALIRA